MPVIEEDARYMIVSSDGHAGASIDGYKEFLEARYRDEFDQWKESFLDPWIDIDPGLGKKKVGIASGILETNWDSGARQTDLDAEGIAGEVLFPNTAPPFFPSGVITAPEPQSAREYELRWAGIRAHNRWLKEFCAEVPGRRAGVAQIFLNDLDTAIREMEWVAESGLTGGVLMPHVDAASPLPPLHSEAYEPLWSAAESLGIPIGHHGALSIPFKDDDGSNRTRLIASVDFPFYSMRIVWQLILSGVFERHPNLKFAFTELPLGWIPGRLALLDGFWREARVYGSRMHSLHGEELLKLELPPSEYFKRNIFIGASFMLPSEIGIRHDVGVDRIMWGADYPHAEGTTPYTTEALRATFAGVPEGDCRQMLGETAARLYNMDIDALRRVADKIGPTVAEVGQPLLDFPTIPDQTQCRVFEKNAAARY